MSRVPNTLRRRLRRAASLLANRPGDLLAPWALPGAQAYYSARWAWMLRRAPLVTGPEHAARSGVAEIEEIIACDLCGQQRFQPLFEPVTGKRRRVRYHVVRCPDCGFLYRQPGIRPERLGDLYSSGGYGSFLTGKYSNKRQRRYRLVMDAFSPLFADGAGRRLLDVGCGAGLFLEVAHQRGFECYGVDLSSDAIDYARKQPWGANTYYGTPQDVPEIAAGGFDVITLWSVLAHLAQPVEDLSMLRRLLAPGGVLLILTVNANSLYFKAQREKWNGFTPNHLKFFSPSTLELLLGKAGFAAVTMPPMPPDSVVAGKTRLSPRQLRRLHRTTERGNTGNMLRAVAYADPGTVDQWQITRHTSPLRTAPGPATPVGAGG